VTLIFRYIQEQVTNIKLEFLTTTLIVFAREAGLINFQKAFGISRPAIGNLEVIGLTVRLVLILSVQTSLLLTAC